MRRALQLLFALQTAAVCLAGQPIGILFDFGSRPEPAVVVLMQSEIRQILAPAHLELSFHRIGDSGASQPFRKIVVVRFHGSCRGQADATGIQLEQPGLLDFPALGKTDISGGRVLPFVQIYCNEVRAFVPSISRTSFAEMYGRALGRVVVHELYHALLNTREHTRTGVARMAQSARDLTREKMALDPLSIGRLRDLYGPKQKEGGSEEPPPSASTLNVALSPVK